MPVFLAYKLSPYTDSPKPTTDAGPTMEERMNVLEKQIRTILDTLGGKKDVSTTNVSNATPTATAGWDT